MTSIGHGSLNGTSARNFSGRSRNAVWLSRARLQVRLHQCGPEPLHYAVSPRYGCGMDITARKR
jgi:hypothetical protein